MRIAVEDPTTPEVVELLAEHLADMHAASPPGSVHALGVDGLRDPAVTFWTARLGPRLLGCAALRELSATEGEVKAMRTCALARRRGVAAALLSAVEDEAARRGYERLSLETGSQDFFAPARHLYASRGFSECGPFGTYVADPHSVFMTKVLATGGTGA
ncbi:MAG TPA: GNAT family N-acetyltransferase [Acidimicrobiales bacterium]|nr:GNAT family N-acetyltransferase [Acidimicrobiales bacterium]